MASDPNEKIDWALRERLESSDEHEVIDAVLTYLLDPRRGDAGEVARSIVGDAVKDTGYQPGEVRILPNIGVIHVVANTALLRRLLDDSRISAASLA